MYACHGNEPNPASSPPTIRRWAVCFANDIPQPKCMHIFKELRKEKRKFLNEIH